MDEKKDSNDENKEQQLSFEDHNDQTASQSNVVHLSQFRDKFASQKEINYFKKVHKNTQHLFNDDEEALEN